MATTLETRARTCPACASPALAVCSVTRDHTDTITAENVVDLLCETGCPTPHPDDLQQLL